MAISKEKKKELVSHYTEILERNSALVLASSSGLSVKEMQELREKIREIGGEFHVVKNTLVKLAFEGAKLPHPENSFDGPTAIGATSEDVPGLAKAMAEVTKSSETFSLKGAVIEGSVLEAPQIMRMAELPALPVLRAQMLGLFTTPASQVAGVINGSLRQVVNVIKAYSESEAAAA